VNIETTYVLLRNETKQKNERREKSQRIEKMAQTVQWNWNRLKRTD
jgi:hypothetical protein